MLGIRVEIGHVNHALRGASSVADEAFVRKLARELGFKFHVARRPIKKLRGANLEETARDQRYAALLAMAERRDCAAIFTAHTQDDQAETLLMNLLRGTGPDGLAGMAPVRSMERTRVRLCRPLLQASKAELLCWLTRSKRRFRHDKSNENRAFLRNWVRRKLMPVLERRSPGFMARMGRLATLSLAEKRHWEREMALLESVLLKPYRGGRLLDLGGLLSYSPAVQRRFLRRCLGRDLLTFEAIERLREWMQSPPTGGRLWQLRKGWIVERLSKSQGSPSPQLFWLKQSKMQKEKGIHEKI